VWISDLIIKKENIHRLKRNNGSNQNKGVNEK